MDVVDAQLKQSNTPLPRIPPVRGRLGFDARFKGFSVKPELVLSNAQRQIFATETGTAGSRASTCCRARRAVHLHGAVFLTTITSSSGFF